MNRRAVVFAVATLLAACATPPGPVSGDRVILLSGSDGTTGAVDVQQGSRAVMLDSAYARASAGSDGVLQVDRADPAITGEQFAAALSSLPPAPASLTVYFLFAQDELTEESRKSMTSMLQDFARRPVPEITVIGHADQVGAERINDALSQKRAERIKDMFVQRGVPADRITIVSRGAREPLVRSADGVAEARNRRAEINIR